MNDHSTLLYTSANFTLKRQPTTSGTLLEMRVPKKNISTSAFPNTIHVLQELAPSVLATKCFNPLNLPFIEEAKSTPTAHLLEHVLIDYLCDEKVLSGEKEACFRGVTRWNWKKNPVGLFHIEIATKPDDENILQLALTKTVRIMELLFHSGVSASQSNYSSCTEYPSLCMALPMAATESF